MLVARRLHMSVEDNFDFHSNALISFAEPSMPWSLSAHMDMSLVSGGMQRPLHML
jgi:hypothetical protein